MQTDKVIKLAKDGGWKLKDNQESNLLLIFTRDKDQINVWWSRMTIGTIVPHPKYKGKRTQMFRKHVSEQDLVRIFNKPRVHTGKGYYHKDGSAPAKNVKAKKTYIKRVRPWHSYIVFGFKLLIEDIKKSVTITRKD